MAKGCCGCPTCSNKKKSPSSKKKVKIKKKSY